MTPEEKEIMERGNANLEKMNLTGQQFNSIPNPYLGEPLSQEPLRKQRSDKGTTRPVQRKVTLTYDLSSTDDRAALGELTRWLLDVRDRERAADIVAQLSKLAVRD